MLRISLASPAQAVPGLPGLPPWLNGLLYARGVRTEDEAQKFLHPALSHLKPPGALYGMERAAECVLDAAKRGVKAVIYGDYDVDGVSASAILWEALDMLGMERRVYIPDRHREGYGLNLAAVEKLSGECGLLITVDCGITSVEEVRRAKELGMTVIVTDHHRHGAYLPEADAVVSPLLGDYPFPFLCGAGVAWKLALRLTGDRALQLMEIAALATVADLVPLTGENRVIVALGLSMLSQTARPGLRALMRRAGIEGEIDSDQVAYQLAPRMNACGRLESAETALRMLLTKDEGEAEMLALRMEKLNQERKSQENAVLEDALAQVEKMDLVAQKAIVVRGEGWNSGVVGLAAGKLAEKYAFPTVALAQDGDVCVGSARSAGSVDIHLALSRCADLFLRFGGHKQAAGLTLPTDRVKEFTERLSRAVSEQTGGKPVVPEILCDGLLPLSEVTEETVQWLKRLEPFGMGNPAPRFLCDGVKPLSLRAVGAEGKHLKCTFQQDKAVRDGIFFGGGNWAGKEDGLYQMVMSPTLNAFRGRVSAECRLYALRLQPESLSSAPEKEALSFLRQPFSGWMAESAEESALDGFMAQGQGTLLTCRRLKTALRLRKTYPEADFCLGKADDPRAFNAVLLYGDPGHVSKAYRRVILCDGQAGDAEAWRRACPGAEVTALPLSSELRELLGELYVDKANLRACYAALRARVPESLQVWSEQTGLPAARAAFALRVLESIGLIDCSFTPFRVALLPMHKRGPEESGLFCAARRAKEDRYGDGI